MLKKKKKTPSLTGQARAEEVQKGRGKRVKNGRMESNTRQPSKEPVEPTP